MSIRPDSWIRARAREGMITPFEERLVRAGVISYGLSSFGYDLRAAPEWRIFVNAFNTVVDPKNFDTRGLVESEGDTCIIPPNSFVLTRSVEYLRVPEDTMVIALGKSSYARCFAADTRVALLDGSAVTLERLAERHREGERFRGYTVDGAGRVVAAELAAPRYIGRDSLLEIVLDDGAVIHATPDHDFMRRDGAWVAAAELTPGTSLMPLYRAVRSGREVVYQPRAGTWAPARAGRASTPGRPARAAGGNGPRRPAPGEPGASAAAGASGALNHAVARVRPLKGEHDVYCLTVPGTGNFALAAGVFVSNCGIVANVTPLEPGWEGHVTLELSNTTPLPAKVYANEGIVQLLFFQGERPDTTYADRAGKYQGQTGVTLPKL